MCTKLALFTRLYKDSRSTKHKITTVYLCYFKHLNVIKFLYLVTDACLPDDNLRTVETCLRCSVLITELHIDIVHLVCCNMTIFFFLSCNVNYRLEASKKRMPLETLCTASWSTPPSLVQSVFRCFPFLEMPME